MASKDTNNTFYVCYIDNKASVYKGWFKGLESAKMACDEVNEGKREPVAGVFNHDKSMMVYPKGANAS